MNRTASLRHSRAPTASQMENPAPPISPTKSGHLFKKNYWHVLRELIAGAFAPELAKKLSKYVQMEKNVMRSMDGVSNERMEVAKQLSTWGETCEDDISDVTDKLGVLIYEIGDLEDQFVDRYDQYCLIIQSIRNIEASVQDTRDRKQKIIDQVAYLKYKKPDSPRIFILEQELVRAEAASLVAEAQLSNHTRQKLKAAFTYQFDALREYGEKLALTAGYGKHLLLELVDDKAIDPGEAHNAYDGYELSAAIVRDCDKALTNWTPSHGAVTSKLSTNARTLSKNYHKNTAKKQQAVKPEAVDDPASSHDERSEHHVLRETYL